LSELTKKSLTTHGRALAFLAKTGNHVARGIGWFYMVTTCVILLSIGCH